MKQVTLLYDSAMFPIGDMPIYRNLHEYPCHAKLSFLMDEVTLICLN